MKAAENCVGRARRADALFRMVFTGYRWNVCHYDWVLCSVDVSDGQEWLSELTELGPSPVVGRKRPQLNRCT